VTALLLDTHAWAWSLVDPDLLSEAARDAIEGSQSVFLSPISLYEICQEVRLGRWDAMAPHTGELPDLVRQQGLRTAELSPAVARHAASRDWAHRDPFDRILASTAELAGLTLVTKDRVFDEVPAVRTVW
jgi:PIN domain nuclease of toxin-antitoxin system